MLRKALAGSGVSRLVHQDFRATGATSVKPLQAFSGINYTYCFLHTISYTGEECVRSSSFRHTTLVRRGQRLQQRAAPTILVINEPIASATTSQTDAR